jgi:hypothetical protein
VIIRIPFRTDSSGINSAHSASTNPPTAPTTAVAQAREVPDKVRSQLLAATHKVLKEFYSSGIHSSPFSYVEGYVFKKILSDLRKSKKAQQHAVKCLSTEQSLGMVLILASA